MPTRKQPQNPNPPVKDEVEIIKVVLETQFSLIFSFLTFPMREETSDREFIASLYRWKWEDAVIRFLLSRTYSLCYFFMILVNVCLTFWVNDMDCRYNNNNTRLSLNQAFRKLRAFSESYSSLLTLSSTVSYYWKCC
jgi:hypothetical protein